MENLCRAGKTRLLRYKLTGLDLIQPGEQLMSMAEETSQFRRFRKDWDTLRHRKPAVDGGHPPSRGLKLLFATKRISEADDAFHGERKLKKNNNKQY